MKLSECPKVYGPEKVTTERVVWKTFFNEFDSLYGSENMNYDPWFQRPHVWSDQQRVAYIEAMLSGSLSGRVITWSSLRGLLQEIPAMYLVDGKQRLNAIRQFVEQDLVVFENLGGLRHSEIARDPEYRDRCYFELQVGYVASLEDMPRWYLTLNSTGVHHTQEELERVRESIEQTPHL